MADIAGGGPIDFRASEQKRDARLRRAMLRVLNEVLKYSPTGFMSGRMLRDESAGLVDEEFESDSHALGLMRDLVNLGLATERACVRRRGEEFGVNYMQLKITADGTALVNEQRPPIAMVDDERIS